MKSRVYCLALVLLLVSGALADQITLVNGKSMEGTFKSGTSAAIVLDVNGQTFTVPIDSIRALSFSSRQPAPPPPPPKPAATTPPSTPQAGPVTVNAGTRLMVKMTSTLLTGQTRAGDKFTATLQTNLVVGDRIVAPAGATMYGRVVESVKAGRLAGKAKLVLEITDITINNQLQPIMTDQFEVTGERQGTLKKVAAGAAVGGIADGNDGAKTGAAVGLGAAVLTKGKQVQIPAGTVLEFALTQPVTVGQ